MTDILCEWLNAEVKLSKQIDKSTLSHDFATGYYLGEILHKYQLQNDFDAFSTGQTADAKLNNFTRVEPTLHLLQIPFDSNVAYDIMMLKHGIVTRLLYQLYIALQRKTKSKLTGVAMETMRAAAPVNLERIETGLYQQRLKTLVPRETDIALQKVSSSFIAKREQNERRALDVIYREAQSYEKVKKEQREADLEKSRIARQRQTELLAKIQAATVHIPKPPAMTTVKAIKQRREMKRKREATEVHCTIEKFEKHLKKLVAPVSSQEIDKQDTSDGTLEGSIEYLQRIKDRLEEDATAREERAKRRRKVLVDQMKAHQAQEEAFRQEQIVQRLMRQSTQEKRIAVQLMQARHEKDVIRRNRIFQEKQHEERRLKDFQDALEREKAMCEQAKADYEAELDREREIHAQMMNEKAQERYRRHYDACHGVLDLIVDFSCKIAEYRELTENKVPDKLVREWRELVLNGEPLYEEAERDRSVEVELAKEEILDNQDFTEYKNRIGEWNLRGSSGSIAKKPANNNILGHVLHRMFGLVAPPPPPTPPPQLPEFTLKVIVLGKMFSGKTTVLTRLCREHSTVHLAIDLLLAEAVESFQAQEHQIVALRSARSLAAIGVGSAAIEPPTPVDGANEANLGDDKEEIGEIQNEKRENEIPADEEEKKDPEKEIKNESDIEVEEGKDVESKEDNLEKMYSSRALLGKRAMDYLSKGEAVSNEILVDIFADAIRKLPEGVGWVLDGFPTTVEQAVMLEKAITGRDVSTPSQSKKSKKKSVLAADPNPEKEPEPLLSGIDMVLVMDVDDEVVLKRAHGRTEAQQLGEQYHQEFRPPPLGSQTGQGKAEQVVSVEDVSFDKEQVQHRISYFHTNWPELEKLYTRISTIRHVDGEVEQDDVYHDVEQCFVDAMEKTQGKAEEEQPASPQETPADEPLPPPEVTMAASVPDEQQRPQSAASRKSRGSATSEGKSRKSSARGRSKDSAKDDKKKDSRPGSAKSPKGKKRGKSATPSPAPQSEPASPEEPSGPPPPQPGEPDWMYVDEPFPLELAESLVPYWENTEDGYSKNLKFTFRQIRTERESIIRYLHQIRVDFKDHLRRPDHKQIFVSAWQKDFNEMSDDLRPDEECKAELHQRLDDLRERLWDICDTRKEQVETERSNLMNEGWVEDHLGLLTNQYLTVMQAEIDRFQDTVQVLKDYYSGMQLKVPSEVGPPSEFMRLPLVELDVGGDPSATPSAATLVSESSTSAQVSPTKLNKKSAEEMPAERGNDQREEGSANLNPVASRTKIPLIQRGGSVIPQATEDMGKAAKKGKAPSNVGQGSESPTADENLEEKTISDAFNFAANLLTTTIQARISDKEAEEEEEKRLKEEAEKAKAALQGGDKKGKSAKGKQSAKGKKGGKKSRSPTPLSSTPVEESEEDRKKRETVIRLRDEYTAALYLEESSVKERLELIKARAQATLTDLRGKTNQTFIDMNQWLGDRYLREMAAVDALGSYARQHIEDAEKLRLELKLEQDEFVVNNERKVVESPVPPPRPPPVETALPDVFTVAQLHNLFAQFKEVAPVGAIMSKAFTELMADTAALSYGLDSLPDMWMAVTYTQLIELCSALSPKSEYIDWRKFLLIVAQPWSKPTADQLLKTRSGFVSVDLAGNGWITKDQYDQVDLWFSCADNPNPPDPEDDEEPYPYNRNRNLRDFFFELFADWEQSPPRLDYINMLMYFAVDKDHLTGVFRALSVASGQAMPKFAMRPDLLLYNADKELTAEDAVAPDVPMEQTTSFKRIHIELEHFPTPYISPESWWLVLHHGSSRLGDSHRFSMVEDPEEKYSMERLRSIYKELGSEDGSPLQIQVLVRHSVIQEAIESNRRHKLPDIRSIFVPLALQVLENQDVASESFGTNA